MRVYHRKTLIRNEHWPLIDNWYWCPLPTIEERVEAEAKVFKPFSTAITLKFSFLKWERDQYKLESRLAHACKDGRIRAPSWVQYYKKEGGAVSIYGKCRHCEEKLSDSIKGIIIMEKEM